MINAEVLIGTVIDNRYRLTRQIGKGSFGWVFEASEEMAGQYVGRTAVKLLAPEDDFQREMVLREIRALAGLTHEYIIGYRTSGQITEGTLGGAIFLVTELGDLALGKKVPPHDQLPEEEVWTMGWGLALALAHIHAKGSVHRDIKPENVLRVEGRWKLGDFGLARAVEGTQMSASGAKGTLRYMAPEVLNNEITAATDVYALGVTLLRCLTGRFAHEGETEAQLIANLMTKPAELPPELPESWHTIIAGCLERQPARRWTAEYLAHQLDPAYTGSTLPGSLGTSGLAARAAVPSGRAGGDLQDRTTRFEDPVTGTQRNLPGALAEPAGLSDFPDNPVLVPMSVETEKVAPRVGKSSIELRLANVGVNPAEEVDGAIEPTEATATVPGGAPGRQRGHPARVRVWPYVAVLVLLVIGAGAYVWRSGTISDMVQRVRLQAVQQRTPGTVSQVMELRVLADRPVDVRRAPNRNAPSLGFLTRDARVMATGKRGEWFRIRMPTGGTAWIHQSAFLKGRSNPRSIRR